MNKLLFIIGLFISFSFLPFPKEEPSILWSETPLTWHNFTKRLKKNEIYDAVTNSAISLLYSGNSESFKITVEALFYPNSSSKKSKKLTDKLLKHEQGHFDITEIFARKFRKSLLEIKFKNFKFLSRDIDRIYDKITNESEKMQNSYDKETKHSMNQAQQLKWNTKIQELLTEFEAYKATEFKLDVSYLK